MEEKGFDILLQAIPLVLKEQPNTHFLFAGDTHISYEPFFEQVQSLIEENKEKITLLGLLDGPELTYFYKSLSLFALSSRSDCFPLTQMEAVRSGVPVVVTNIPGARMLVKETGCGIIVPAEHVKQLARAIITILQNPADYRKKTADAVQWLDFYAVPKLD
ncbi:MAG: putative poly(glycerol-phosphate) alpha-glucosyltransferase [Microgenomates bacterium OLB22]|nr:MAG: putative poly(glycerol-phosphate) alpha-glucosyltransferase [Microgenomates bacterium OLB22]